MHEYVFATVVGLNEAITFLHAVKFHFAHDHRVRCSLLETEPLRSLRIVIDVWRVLTVRLAQRRSGRMVRPTVDALPPLTFYACSPPRHEKTFSVSHVLTCETHAVTIRPSDSFRHQARRHAPPCASPFPLRDVSAFPASFAPWPDCGRHAADCS